MKWSWRIARIAGIDVHVHATFVLLIGFYGLWAYQRTRSTPATALAVASVLLLFVIVLMHEYGHALAARRYGIATQDITLLDAPVSGGRRTRVVGRPRAAARSEHNGRQERDAGPPGRSPQRQSRAAAAPTVSSAENSRRIGMAAAELLPSPVSTDPTGTRRT